MDKHEILPLDERIKRNDCWEDFVGDKRLFNVRTINTRRDDEALEIE